MHKFGMLLGGAYNYIDQNIFNGRLPFTLRDDIADHASMKPASDCNPVVYPKPDGKLSFDKPSSVYLSNTNHEENQPVHLKLADASVPIQINLPRYAEPATSGIARSGCTRWWWRTTRRASASTRRTAFTARPATSRTPARTSPG